jgi:N-acetylglucosamine kinase-like BadF-type ATPase
VGEEYGVTAGGVARAMAAVLAVDGGNSKTDVALLAADGSVLGHVRGAGSNPQTVGVGAARATLTKLVDAVRQRAGLTGDGPAAEVAALCLAGADLPEEVARATAWAGELGWARRVVVETDIVAMLHASPHAENAVAVVCGGGINAIGLRGADGATVRFPALGMLTGDWGGGMQLAMEVMFAASRAEDGRGPATALADAVCSLWGTDSVRDAAEAVHTGRIAFDRLHELPPLIFTAAADGDPVAAGLVNRLADEVAGMAASCLRRLDVESAPATVLLGGGVLLANAETMVPAVRRRLTRPEAGPPAGAAAVEVGVITAPPIVGAAVFGFGVDQPAGPEVLDRVRAALITELNWRG